MLTTLTLDNDVIAQAALAIEHGLVLCCTDFDFSAFIGLRWEKEIVPE